MSFTDSIKQLDTDLFLYLNSKHNAFWDFVMFWASHRFVFIPLYAFFLFLAWKHYGKKVWLVALCAVLLIVSSDQISVHAFKNVFLRYRPCYNEIICKQVHLNDGRGGQYGFISSHAANTFALAMFLFLLFRGKIKFFGLLIFVWAAFVSYSRIYNGVHYPLDVATGAVVGMGIGVVVFKIFQYADRKTGTHDTDLTSTS
jgi:undecaprenyl-diphosphatase